MARVAAHQVAAAHFHQLAALERPDGLEVLCHQPGDGGLAGAGVAGEDHMHGQAGRLEPGGGAALLHLQVVCQTEHIVLDRGKAHQRVQLGADLVHSTGVLRRQQAEQVCRGGPVQGKLQPLRHGSQGHGAGKGRIGLQAVFAQGAEDAVTAQLQTGRALLLGALGGHIVPHVCPGGKGEPQPGAHLLGQRVQLLRRHSGQIFPRKGDSGAHIPHRRDEGRTELVGQHLPALVGEEDQVLSAGVDAAHRTGRQRGTGIHQNALLVDQVPAGQRCAAPGGKVGDGF